MGLFEADLDKALSYYQSIRDSYLRIIEYGPQGKLLHQVNNGRDQFLHSYLDGDRRVRKGITKNESLIRQLAQTEFARKALEILEQDIELLSGAVSGMIPFDPDKILMSMTNAYKLLPEDYFFDRDQTAIDLNLSDADKARIARHKEWGEQPYKISDYYAEYRKIRTSRGELVRSKNELLIVEDIYRFGIAKRYEQELIIGDVRFIPDFTFEGASRDEFYWDHFGMMGNREYAKRNYRKLDKLYDAGIIPGKNLIVTFDMDGSINMGMIDAVIRNEVIPRL